MPTKKVDATWIKNIPPCRDSDHSPPKHYVFGPGHYVHTCPTCGMETFFYIPEVMM